MKDTSSIDQDAGIQTGAPSHHIRHTLIPVSVPVLADVAHRADWPCWSMVMDESRLHCQTRMLSPSLKAFAKVPQEHVESIAVML